MRRAILVCALLGAFVPVEAPAARYPVSIATLFGLPATPLYDGNGPPRYNTLTFKPSATPTGRPTTTARPSALAI